MLNWWWKVCKVFQALINRVLDNGRKKPFKQYIKKMKEMKWLKDKGIEIQENDEGKWIEIHLNETADDAEDDQFLWDDQSD